jgi:uncharacterized protein with HEPN domain
VSRQDSQRLADIVEAIRAVRAHREAGEATQAVTRDAVLYRLVVIGEAAGALSEATRAAAPEIEWQAIVGLRNRLAHAYWQVSLELIDEIVEGDLDPLDEAAQRLLAD